MPELPEVETLCRQLKEVITAKKILRIQILDTKIARMEKLEGRATLLPYRTGKSLNIGLDDGRTLKLHLRMTGRLLWQEGHPVDFPHTRFMMTFDNGRLDLIDPRRFATLEVQSDVPCSQAELDPLHNFSPSLLQEKGAQKTLPIKSFIMDQRRISGIGNIYACEILHSASISPRRKTNGLSPAEWEEIAVAAGSILREAIIYRGTSISDWRDLFGKKGEYQHYLKVYGRAGTSCTRCGGVIERVKLGGRGTYFCPSCQT